MKIFYIRLLLIPVIIVDVNSKEQRTWVFANGIKYIEGDIVQKIKNTVLGAVDIEN